MVELVHRGVVSCNHVNHLIENPLFSILCHVLLFVPVTVDVLLYEVKCIGKNLCMVF